jgi:hypothetical protein
MKNVAKCWKDFLSYFTTLETYREWYFVEQRLATEGFLTGSWRFLISNKLEQLEFKLEKIIGI